MNNGTFVEIEYVGRIKESGEIFDLTDEALAREKKIWSPNVKYGPITVILGNRQILAGVENKIKEMKPGEKKTFILPAKEAFGERSAQLIKTFLISEFHKQNMQPQAGQFMRLGNGLEGRVLSVSGGRVRVDFNHPLSGKSLDYELKLDRIIDKTEEQVLAIVAYYSKTEAKAIKIDSEKGIATIETGGGANISPAAKKKISDDIAKFVSGIKDVSFVGDSGENKPESKEKPRLSNI